MWKLVRARETLIWAAVALSLPIRAEAQVASTFSGPIVIDYGTQDIKCDSDHSVRVVLTGTGSVRGQLVSAEGQGNGGSITIQRNEAIVDCGTLAPRVVAASFSVTLPLTFKNGFWYYGTFDA